MKGLWYYFKLCLPRIEGEAKTETKFQMLTYFYRDRVQATLQHLTLTERCTDKRAGQGSAIFPCDMFRSIAFFCFVLSRILMGLTNYHKYDLDIFKKFK